METSELIKKVKKIQILTSHLVNDALAGGYTSAFRGTGMEFDKVREYQVGDDVRDIDWNVTARSNHAQVKRYVEEREMTVMILVDGSSSVLFGSGNQSKMELASELSAVLAFSAIANSDKVGLMLFTDKIDLYLPPKKGKDHVLRVIREILSFKPKNSKTNISNALEFLAKVQKRKCVAFLVSDYLDHDFEKPLNTASRKHDLISVKISDQRENELPNLGLMCIEDAETGQQIMVDTSSKSIRALFKSTTEKQNQALDTSFKRRKIDTVAIQTNENYLLPLKLLFKKREKKR
jgi:uncharacterized protein (DUF58 family)